MEKISIGILCEDFDFKQALIKGISVQDSGIIIEGIDCFEQIIDNKKYEIVLIDEGSYNNFIDKRIDPLPNNILVLSDKKITCDLKDKNFVNKYSGVDEILDKTKEIYFQTTGNNRDASFEGKTKILSFCSDKGGSGVTSTALETARQLARYESKNVVYLNAESIDSSRNYLPLDKDGDVRKLFIKLDFFKNGKRDYPIESYLKKHEKISYFKSTSPYNYLASNPKLFKKILEIINHQKNFDYIIVDFGNELKKEWTEIINQSHIIFFIQKEQEAKSALGDLLIEPLDKNKFKIFFTNKKLFINNEKQVDSKGLIVIDPLSPFSKEITKLVKLIIAKENLG